VLVAELEAGALELAALLLVLLLLLDPPHAARANAVKEAIRTAESLCM
jgi:hypothetical protein